MSSCAYQLKTKLWLPVSRSSVFALFTDAFTLEELTPPFLGFRVVTPEPIDMKLGRLIDYRLKLHGLPIGWRTEITEWEPPFRFEDSQIRGPYSMWIHSHTFEESGSGTLVRDSVRYSVPGGTLIHALMVKRDLRRIFEYRCAQLPRLLGVDPTECDAGEVEIRRLQRLPQTYVQRPSAKKNKAATGSISRAKLHDTRRSRSIFQSTQSIFDVLDPRYELTSRFLVSTNVAVEIATIRQFN